MAQKKKVAKESTQSKDTEAEDEAEVSTKQAHASEIEKVQEKRLQATKTRRQRKRSTSAVSKRKKIVSKKMARPPRDIGIDVPAPVSPCQDEHCPFHGNLSVRGQIITGIVVSSKMARSIVVKREKTRYIPKYQRYEKRTRNFRVHNPPCLDVQVGDAVRIMECRPISKAKTFVVISREA